MKIHLFMLPIIFAVLSFPPFASAKVLLIVENSYYTISKARVLQCSTDVRLYDNKSVEVVPWTVAAGTNVQQCRVLWNFLESKYNAYRFTADPLEGAVLIGNLPVPQYYAGEGTEPFDYYYMDIWNSATNGMYPNHDMTPFTTDASHSGYFSPKYNVGGGDGKVDIWVSRIYGTLIAANGHLRSSAPGGNPNTVLNEAGIYNEYLERLHQRYAEPAAVPSRGFAMGGTADMIASLQEALGMDQLNLPMYVEFYSGASNNTGGASAFNFMSQLQAGPRGGTTYGAYNGTIFPNERNARNCTYSQLIDARPYAPYNNRSYTSLDNSGWEWAGVFVHSNPVSFAFNHVGGISYNGSFSSGTYGPFWGNSLRRTGGYVPPSGNPSGYYFYYNCDGIGTDPYNYQIWRGKRAYFQYNVRATGTYAVYLYYVAGPNNCDHVSLKLVESRLNASGYPSGGSPVKNIPYLGLDMRTHENPYENTNWEFLYYGVTLTENNMATLMIEANGEVGDVVADAVRFVCTSPAIDDIVDNAEPATVPAGPAIFSTQGFYTNDWIDRSFNSMQDENGATHDKFSKTPFFLTSTCGTNNYIARIKSSTVDNLGNLLALGHNGLICIGTSNDNYPSRNYSPFIMALAAGKNFGQALVNQVNSSFKLDNSNNLICMYALLGAGFLRAQPYVQYGSAITQNTTISTPVTNNSANPVLIRGVTVTSTGTYTVTSTVIPSGVNCARSEIIIRPETEFRYGSNITIKAY